MIKDKCTFANLDENFFGIIHNASKTHSENLGKGDVEFSAENSNEKLKKKIKSYFIRTWWLEKPYFCLKT